MKIYTKYGDTGQTRIVGGRRVDKDDFRVESYGLTDELCAFIGVTLALLPEEWALKKEIAVIQQQVFDCGSDLAVADYYRSFKVDETMVISLEELIDQHIEEIEKIEKFIMPGGGQIAASIHVLRTVCRRAERMIVRLMKQEDDSNPFVLKYMNRLSDYFFVAARVANQLEGITDTLYENSEKIFKEKKKGD